MATRKKDNTKKILLALLVGGGIYAATKKPATQYTGGGTTGGGTKQAGWMDILNNLLGLGKEVVKNLPDKEKAQEDRTGHEQGHNRSSAPQQTGSSYTGQQTTYFAEPAPAAVVKTPTVYFPAVNKNSVSSYLQPTVYFPAMSGCNCKSNSNLV